jgi:cardiolipin synthase (CMP-forming)
MPSGSGGTPALKLETMSTRIFTPSNQITLLRLLFVPVFAILILDRSYRAALLVLTAAAVSDVLDGLVARLLKQESALGVALDPIADKILMTTGYIALSLRGALPWWLTVLVLSRDVVILTTALIISLVAGYRPFHPSLLGKASTAAQVATLFAAVCHRARVPYANAELVTFLLYVTAALTVTSGVHYVFLIRQRFGSPEANNSV